MFSLKDGFHNIYTKKLITVRLILLTFMKHLQFFLFFHSDIVKNSFIIP